ncbi:putative thyroid hormone receptor interactor 13 [Cryptosporidium serpentis]
MEYPATIPTSLNRSSRATPKIEYSQNNKGSQDSCLDLVQDSSSTTNFKCTNMIDSSTNLRNTEREYTNINRNICKIPLSVEVCIHGNIEISNNVEINGISRDIIARRIEKYLLLQASVKLGRVEICTIGDSFLRKICKDIVLSLMCPVKLIEERNTCENTCDGSTIPIYQVDPIIFIYQLNNDSYEYTLEESNGEVNGSDTPIWQHWELPNESFHGLWEALHYDTGIKQQLLDYASASLILSDHSINYNVINWNHLILLYGSPGTGKTSISRAIAQKIGIRYSSRYDSIHLIEISAHSLFSKWFSESGKLVVRLFTKIREVLENSNSFVTLVIDEVESLTSARKQCMSRNEPSDSLRVVNALLTQIDSLKRYPNTLIMTTTNIPDAIDDAFLDRADLKIFIPLPSLYTRYLILVECIQEFIKKSVILNKRDIPAEFLPFRDVMQLKQSNLMCHNLNIQYSMCILSIAKKTDQFSGRNIRKLPFIVLTHSYHYGIPISIDKFMEKLECLISNKRNSLEV